MALILGDLYAETKNRFQLELIAGKAGLGGIIKWVYITEDYSTSDFLSGGELVLTTGVLSEGKTSWLLCFLHHIVVQHTCGLILNIGSYLRRENITQEVLDFCDEHRFPLFLMPWRIHFYDITRDYYSRLFLDARRNEEIDDALSVLLDPYAEHRTALAQLLDKHFPEEAPYFLIVLDLSHGEAPTPERSRNAISNQQLIDQIDSLLASKPFLCHSIVRSASFLLICQSKEPEPAEKLAIQILREIQDLYPDLSPAAGLGGRSSRLSKLSKSYEQALAALKTGQQGKSLYRYQDMGFFKLLLGISDTELLQSYVDYYLRPIRVYDARHHRDFARTLYLYLLYRGSIQEVSKVSFCHRNTVNHRIQIIREQLGYRLDDPMVCFELMAAFQADDYLNHR